MTNISDGGSGKAIEIIPPKRHVTTNFCNSAWMAMSKDSKRPDDTANQVKTSNFDESSDGNDKSKPTEIGQQSEKNVSLEGIERKLMDLGLDLESEEVVIDKEFEEPKVTTKRIYRQRKDYPNPDKPPWAAENRVNYNLSKKQVNVRLDPELLKIVEEAAEKSGLNRTSWMTAAFIKAAREEGFDVPMELEPQPDGP